mgnify:CR=1 FL=1
MEELNKELIAELESLRSELKDLRAWKAEIEKQEPVGSVFQGNISFNTDGGPDNWRNRKEYSGPVFAAPVSVEKLRQALADTGNQWSELYSRAETKLTRLCAENKSLKAELEAARKDAERLDWLLSQSDATICSDGVYGPFHIWFRYSNRTTDDAPTARAAIDAAIEQAKGS